MNSSNLSVTRMACLMGQFLANAFAPFLFFAKSTQKQCSFEFFQQLQHLGVRHSTVSRKNR